MVCVCVCVYVCVCVCVRVCVDVYVCTKLANPASVTDSNKGGSRAACSLDEEASTCYPTDFLCDDLGCFI